jgi:pSer/pThr/pTyr-binding forkhead associated (FHA) protein
MSYSLVPIDGGAPPISLVRPVLLIGRHPECDIRINLTKISRRHCSVALAYDRVLIRDLGSRNGLRVNGRVVEEARLFAGDEVAIGPLIYRMVVEPEPADVSNKLARRPSTATPAPAHPDQGQRGASTDRPRPGDSDDVGLVPLDSL